MPRPTTKDVLTARKLYAQGWTKAEIARHLGRPRNTIYSWVDPAYAERRRASANDWKNKHPGKARASSRKAARKARRTCPSCGNKMGIGSRGKICWDCHVQDQNFIYSDLQRLWNADVPVEEIARELGFTVHTVYNYTRRARKSGFDLRRRNLGSKNRNRKN